jgi:ABC-2 type transport system permease protein
VTRVFIMKKTLLVLRHEILTILSRPSFLFALFGIPFIGAMVFVVAAQLSKGSQAASMLSTLVSNQPTVNVEGYVDQSGIIKTVPNTIPAGVLIAYPDEASALQALQSGQISTYYVISADYVSSGRIDAVQATFNPLGSQKHFGDLQYILNYNLLDNNSQLTLLINGPKNVEVTSLSSAPQREQNNMLTFFLPYAVTMLFYIVILSAASLLLSSVAKEKENRMIEILLLSVTPNQLLTGKIVGLGLLGLVQIIIWVGTGRILLAESGTTFNLPIAFQLPPSFLVWGVIFFLLGYAVYASLMAGLGALVPNLREATQATILVIFPLIIPIMLISVLINEPNSVLSVLLSLFPLTAPVTMMTRLSAGSVPLWQTILSAVLLAATAILVVRSVARMFHAQTILSGQPFSRKLFITTLFGKA